MYCYGDEGNLGFLFPHRSKQFGVSGAPSGCVWVFLIWPCSTGILRHCYVEHRFLAPHSSSKPKNRAPVLERPGTLEDPAPTVLYQQIIWYTGLQVGVLIYYRYDIIEPIRYKTWKCSSRGGLEMLRLAACH